MNRRRFSAKALTARLLEFNGKCPACGGKFGGAHGAPEWDHIIALEMGGEDVIENLQPLHKGCHRSKTDQDVKHIAKGNRMNQRAMGIGKQTRRPLPGSKASGWKQRMDGTWEKRT